MATDGHLVPAALLPLDVAAGLHLGDLAAQLGHPRRGSGAGPSRSWSHRGRGCRCRRRRAARAAHLPGQRLAPAAQPRQHVLHLRQRDLRLALPGLGVLGEDVEDQRGPVDDLDLDDVLQAGAAGRGSAHRRRSRCRRRSPTTMSRSSRGLARADVGRRVGLVAPLDHAVEHHRAGGLGERGQLAQGVLRVLDACPRSRRRPARRAPGAAARYSTSVTSSSSVERPATRRSACRSARSRLAVRGRRRDDRSVRCLSWGAVLMHPSVQRPARPRLPLRLSRRAGVGTGLPPGSAARPGW